MKSKMHKISKYFTLVLIGFLAFAEPSKSVGIECDFETDFCDYTPNYHFERYKGKAPGQFSGPPSDHTTGTGYYALCKGELLSSINTCQMNKTFTNDNQELDYTFWYYFNGLTVGSLELLKDNEIIWSENVAETAWKKAVVRFPVGTFKVKNI